jgi:hypothetical protein
MRTGSSAPQISRSGWRPLPNAGQAGGEPLDFLAYVSTLLPGPGQAGWFGAC